jgi:twitching motility protein PilT
MYVTPGIQNLIRENKTFRIDSEIQTGKKYGMQLLDDNLFQLFVAGKISAEEAIDKSKNPGGMVDRMNRHGYMTEKKDEFPEAGESGEADGKTASAPAGPANEAERQAQITANRARMQAAAAKR